MLDQIEYLEQIFNCTSCEINWSQRSMYLRLLNDLRREYTDDLPQSQTQLHWYKTNLMLIICQIKSKLPVYFPQKTDCVDVLNRMINHIQSSSMSHCGRPILTRDLSQILERTDTTHDASDA